MGDTRRRRPAHRRQLWLSFATATALAFLLFATSAVGLNSTRQLSSALTISTSRDLFTMQFAQGEKSRQQLKGIAHNLGLGRVEWTKSRLSGPGSSPPKCISKCGRCRPCKPTRVAIHPGVSTPLEYYPEAWRCKCGNKLFMP